MVSIRYYLNMSGVTWFHRSNNRAEEDTEDIYYNRNFKKKVKPIPKPKIKPEKFTIELTVELDPHADSSRVSMEIEKLLFKECLKRFGGNIGACAKALGVSDRHLRLLRHKIKDCCEES